MENCHAVVWIDHKSAHVIMFNRSEHVDEIVRHHDPEKHIHHKAGTMGSGHIYEDDEYLHDVSDAIRDARAVLITGPSQVKWQFKSFLGLREPALADRITGVETLNHPSDGELLAIARKAFRAKDRLG